MLRQTSAHPRDLDSDGGPPTPRRNIFSGCSGFM